MNAPLCTLLHRPQSPSESLADQVPQSAPLCGIVALCGGGGKTTLMYGLAAEIAAQGRPVICSTTTRVFPPAIPAEVQDCLLNATDDTAKSVAALAAFITHAPAFPVFVAHSRETVNGVEKLRGLSPEVLDALAERFPEHLFLVEADGAAHKPLKAPAPHEPVIPSRTGLVVAVVGLEIFSRPFSSDLAHRPELVQSLTGLQDGDPVTLPAVRTLVEHPKGLFQHCPPTARRVVFGNKADAFPPPADWPWAFGSAAQRWVCLGKEIFGGGDPFEKGSPPPNPRVALDVCTPCGLQTWPYGPPVGSVSPKTFISAPDYPEVKNHSKHSLGTAKAPQPRQGGAS